MDFGHNRTFNIYFGGLSDVFACSASIFDVCSEVTRRDISLAAESGSTL